MANKLKDEVNVFRVWQSVTDHLTSEDLTMQWVTTLWSKFFNLRCEEMDNFLPFYSNVITILDKLEQSESIAAKDNLFL